MTYSYDEHGRVLTTTDARNGATTYAYNAADQVTSVTTPTPAAGQNPQIMTSYFDNLGRATKVTFADNTSVTNEYFLTGELKRSYGSRTYPVGYGYDAQGRLTTMTNWTTFASAGERVTTWNYDDFRGFLTNKVYAGETDTTADYEYTAAGRLWKRHWERGVSSTNSYSAAGELQAIDYSDNTPDVSFSYDRRGQQTTTTNGTTVTTLTYNDAGQLLSESYSGGHLNGLTVTNTYDSLLRRTSLALNTQPSTINHGFGYDSASRLTNVTDGTYSAGYTYLANSPLVSQITLRSNTTVRMTTTKAYDYLNRLTSISSVPSAQPAMPLSWAYQYNDANQRTRVTLADGSYWVYEYDALGQVKSGKKYWVDGTPVAGQQFEYGHDDIGNRSSTKAGGDASGNNLRSATYSANSLNQYTNRTVPNAFDVIGIANGTAVVTVNSSAADYRRNEYFQELVSVSNSSTSVWQSVTVATSGGVTSSGNIFVPMTPENFSYDLDGNLTNDGRWTLTWDGENRLTKMETLSTVPDAAKKRLEFAYDHRGRRIQKIVSTWNGSAYVAQSTNRFVYDGWNLTAVLTSDLSLQASFLWGLDLSGSMQGAGGVGGLLAVSTLNPQPSTSFVAYDGNGNVTGLIDATNYSPGRMGRKGALVFGHVLEYRFEKDHLARRQRDGSYLAAGGGKFSKQKTFLLGIGASREVYYGTSQINSAVDNPGAGYSEKMSGNCSCQLLK